MPGANACETHKRSSTVKPEVSIRNELDAGFLQVSATQPANGGMLMGFGFGVNAPDFVATGLEFLGGDLQRECWNVPSPVSVGSREDVTWRQAGNFLFVAIERPDDGAGDLAEASREAYTDLLKLTRDLGYPKLLRLWNFMPGINLGAGDLERYRRFCVGRGRAMDEGGITEPELCAGTAIGSSEPTLRIYSLSGKQSGWPLENPRQTSAYHYPRQYGPRGPAFARSTALSRPDGTYLLMISGTASVVGHATVHTDDLEAQLDEIVRNINTLLAKCAHELKRPRLVRFGAESMLRVYVRNKADWPLAMDRLKQAWPDSAVAGLHGDICRRDLLLEVEAVHCG